LVLHNDEVDIDGIQQLLAAGQIHHIILSPGPGTPHNPKDIGEIEQRLQQQR
jgi:para-aminobenzoate synthetase